MSDTAIIVIVVTIGLIIAGVLYVGTDFINRQRRTGPGALIGGGVGDVITGALGFVDFGQGQGQ